MLHFYQDDRKLGVPDWPELKVAFAKPVDMDVDMCPVSLVDLALGSADCVADGVVVVVTDALPVSPQVHSN